MVSIIIVRSAVDQLILLFNFVLFAKTIFEYVHDFEILYWAEYRAIKNLLINGSLIVIFIRVEYCYNILCVCLCFNELLRKIKLRC